MDRPFPSRYAETQTAVATHGEGGRDTMSSDILGNLKKAILDYDPEASTEWARRLWRPGWIRQTPWQQ